MITVHYTVAALVKGEVRNIYKSRQFEDHAASQRFIKRQLGRTNVTDVYMIDTDKR